MARDRAHIQVWCELASAQRRSHRATATLLKHRIAELEQELRAGLAAGLATIMTAGATITAVVTLGRSQPERTAPHSATRHAISKAVLQVRGRKPRMWRHLGAIGDIGL
jgi:hypothetical protein